MTVRPRTTINNVEKDVLNSESRQLILLFFEFMKTNGTSEKYQINDMKAITAYSIFLGSSHSLYQIKRNDR